MLGVGLLDEARSPTTDLDSKGSSPVVEYERSAFESHDACLDGGLKLIRRRRSGDAGSWTNQLSRVVESIGAYLAIHYIESFCIA